MKMMAWLQCTVFLSQTEVKKSPHLTFPSSHDTHHNRSCFWMHHFSLAFFHHSPNKEKWGPPPSLSQGQCWPHHLPKNIAFAYTLTLNSPFIQSSFHATTCNFQPHTHKINLIRQWSYI